MPWNSQGSIRGPQGPQGTQGPQGIQGQQGVQGLQGVQGPAGIGIDRPGGFVSTNPPTRRASFSWGGGGGPTFTDKNTGFQRMPFILPVRPVRWRLRISNRNASGVTTGAGAATYGPFYIASTFRNFTTGEPNHWTGALQQALPASPQQAVGAEWVSGWVTDAAHMPTAGIMFTLQMSWSKAAGSTVYSSAGGSYVSTNMGDVTNGTAGMTYADHSAFSVTMEYEFEGTNKIFVASGDSISEGMGVRFNYQSWHQQFSMRHKVPVCLSAAIGATAGASTNSYGHSGAGAVNEPRWARLKAAQCNIDAAIFFLGTNDSAFGGNLTTFQDGSLLAARRARSEWGVRDVYFCTIPPQNQAAGTRETIRNQINAWLRGGFPQEFETLDPAPLMEAGVNSANLRPGLEGFTPSADYTHFGPPGHLRFIDSLLVPV